MLASPPLVSVSMLTYNHEKYIAEAIRSVLNQSCRNLELVIVDDGSTDGTPQIIASFDDPRIVSIRQTNQGPSVAANRAYQTCRGRYIALMSGDDVCHPDRLERQLSEYARGGTRMLFSAVDLIDDEGRPLVPPSPLHDLFEVRPASRAQLYRRFFDKGNFINAITGFTETHFMQTYGMCDPCLLQLQDLDLWIRLLKSHDVCIMPQSTLNYRIRGDGQNLSGQGTDQWVWRNRRVRCANELFLIMRRFFDDVSPELFYEAFHDELLRPDCMHPIAMRCEQAFLLVRSLSTYQQLAGIEKFHELFADPEQAAVLQRDYQFGLPAFYRLLGELPVFNLLIPDEWFSTLFFDSGRGFNEQDACRTRVNLLSKRFDITFDLSGAPCVRQLRWDPFEGRLSRVYVEEIAWRTPEGKRGVADVSEISANGVRGGDGVYPFDTLDPMFFVPFTGPLTCLTVRGWWDIQTSEATQIRYMNLLREQGAFRAELSSRDEQLHCILTSRRWRAAEKIHSIWRLLRDRRAA